MPTHIAMPLIIATVFATVFLLLSRTALVFSLALRQYLRRRQWLSSQLRSRPAQKTERRLHLTQWELGQFLSAIFFAIGLFVVMLLTDTQTNALFDSQWQAIALLVTAAAVIIAGLARMYYLWRLSRELQFSCDAALVVGQSLERMDKDNLRVFHEVELAEPDAQAIDYVVVGPRGLYAVHVIALRPDKNGSAQQHNNRLVFSGTSLTLDLSQITLRVNSLQHELGKSIGKSVRLRSVIALPGWRVVGERGEKHLITDHSDVVMLQGWRDASDALLTDEVDALQAYLEQRSKTPVQAQAHGANKTPPLLRPA